MRRNTKNPNTGKRPGHGSENRTYSPKRLATSFRYALKGIRTALKTEANLRIHFTAAIVAIAAALFLQVSTVELSIIFILIGLVLSAEMINTAFESIVDLVQPEYHQLAEKAKDVAAGAVLICAIVALTVGLMIFVPKLWLLF